MPAAIGPRNPDVATESSGVRSVAAVPVVPEKFDLPEFTAAVRITVAVYRAMPLEQGMMRIAELNPGGSEWIERESAIGICAIIQFTGPAAALPAASLGDNSFTSLMKANSVSRPENAFRS